MLYFDGIQSFTKFNKVLFQSKTNVNNSQNHLAMSTFDKLSRTIPTKNGLFIFGGLTAFFLIMRLVGLAEIYWLRSLNLLIVLVFLRNAILSFKHESHSNYYDDFTDMFRIGLRTSFIGVGLFSVFLALYLDQIDTPFMESLAVKESFGGQITAVSAAFIVFVEGMVSSMAASFVLIQLFKTKTVEAHT